ncbi:hypothetical protein Tco_1123222 [Tanacetum coccineum]|uniref:Reverse transcriptase Ty1/copia-type domain-containing protein n=1 Tax=Tanacetum coccineum TaxID=301880 RepID=A0ABQ5J2R0_9ASTR
MFDEIFNPPTIDVSPVPVANVPRAGDLADSPVSASIDQDASSTNIPSTQEQEYSLIISQGFEESPKTLHFHDDPLHESLHEDSTSQGSSSNVRPIHTPFESLGRWTKDHLIANVIGDPSRFVKTDEFGGVLKNKARLVAQGFSQQEYDDFPNGCQNGVLKWRAQRRGAADPTLFTRKAGNDLLLAQIYVDDINICQSTNTALSNEFAIHITTNSDAMMGQYTPMVEKNKLDEDLQGITVDATLYRDMIGSLIYLTSSRPDLLYAVCLCARYQAKPTENHLNAQIQNAITGCQDTRRSTSGSSQFLGDKLVSWSSKKQKSTAISST